MPLGGNGSPECRKQSIWRGCPTATDRPETIFGPKMIKKVDSRRSKNNEKTNARRRILHLSGLKNSIKKGREMAIFIHFPHVKRITFSEGLGNGSLKKRPWRFKNIEKTNARSRFLQNVVVENELQKVRKC